MSFTGLSWCIFIFTRFFSVVTWYISISLLICACAQICILWATHIWNSGFQVFRVEGYAYVLWSFSSFHVWMAQIHKVMIESRVSTDSFCFHHCHSLCNDETWQSLVWQQVVSLSAFYISPCVGMSSSCFSSSWCIVLAIGECKGFNFSFFY
jgi:hypothetical protein